MAKISLTKVQKAAIFDLSKSTPNDQKTDSITGDTLILGTTYTRQTMDTLRKKGITKKIKGSKAEGIPTHYILTEAGQDIANTLQADTTKPVSISPYRNARGQHMSMQAALDQIGADLRSATVFELMRLRGLLRKVSRMKSSGQETYFYVLTEDGEEFGKNLPGFHPEEIDIVFLPQDIPRLLKRLELS